jgi:hypothetical protein
MLVSTHVSTGMGISAPLFSTSHTQSPPPRVYRPSHLTRLRTVPARCHADHLVSAHKITLSRLRPAHARWCLLQALALRRWVALTLQTPTARLRGLARRAGMR